MQIPEVGTAWTNILRQSINCKKMEKQETNCLRFVEIQTETCPKYVWTVSLCVKLFFCTFHFQRRKTCLFFVKTFHLAILNFCLNKQNFRSGLRRQKANICHKHKKNVWFYLTTNSARNVYSIFFILLHKQFWVWLSFPYLKKIFFVVFNSCLFVIKLI